MNGLLHFKRVEVRRGIVLEARVERDAEAVLFRQAHQPRARGLHVQGRCCFRVARWAGGGVDVVGVEAFRHVCHRFRGGRLACRCGVVVERLVGAVREVGAPPALLRGVEVNWLRNERVVVHESDEGELVDVMVPVVLDAGVTDADAFHRRKPRRALVQNLVGEGGDVVAAVRLSSNVKVVHPSVLWKEVKPTLKKRVRVVGCDRVVRVQPCRIVAVTETNPRR
mmetsp:Transcript_54560/g.109713  ORF Transcript_54560/g.109713 Transcript_54560/m.109713 type:complete len:224 (+) Transcript_54560:653-1324(+)